MKSLSGIVGGIFGLCTLIFIYDEVLTLYDRIKVQPGFDPMAMARGFVEFFVLVPVFFLLYFVLAVFFARWGFRLGRHLFENGPKRLWLFVFGGGCLVLALHLLALWINMGHLPDPRRLQHGIFGDWWRYKLATLFYIGMPSGWNPEGVTVAELPQALAVILFKYACFGYFIYLIVTERRLIPSDR